MENIEYRHFRNSLINKLFFYLSIFSTIAGTSSLLRIIDVGWQPVFGIQLVIIASIILTTILRHKIAFRFKRVLLVALFYITAITSGVNLGLGGFMLGFLIIVLIISNIFFDIRVTIINLIISSAVIIAIAVYWCFFPVADTISFGPFQKNITSWATSFFSFSLLAGFITIISSRFSEHLITLLKEKEILLNEVHHHVKNDMSIINSIIQVKSHDLKDGESKRVIEGIQNNIAAMMRLYEKLYKTSSKDKVDFASFLDVILKELETLYSGKISIIRTINSCFLAPRTTLIAGIIINECITNSLKHAPKKGQAVVVKVSSKVDGKNVDIRIKDNGKTECGGNKTGFGLEMIHSLATQLKGTFELHFDQGCQSTLRFPIDRV